MAKSDFSQTELFPSTHSSKTTASSISKAMRSRAPRIHQAKTTRLDEAEQRTSPTICDTQPSLPTLNERYLKDKDVAARFGVARQTVWRWSRDNQNFPKPIEITPGTSRWRLSDFERFEATLGDHVPGGSK